jgi:protein gp37
MSNISRIEWTESSWNPITGCTKISSGCNNCYAEKMANRLKMMGSKNYENGFKLTCHQHALNAPLQWKKPRMIFVCSMSDIFHKDVPDDFILNIFEVIKKSYWHTFQILTKRSERFATFTKTYGFPSNAWAGVTVENADVLFRADHLRQVPSKIKFISAEPLVGSIKDLNLNNINWVVAGGESGANSRPLSIEWAREIRDKCIKENISFFFKQWGGTNKKATGRILDGKLWNEMPEYHQNMKSFIK